MGKQKTLLPPLDPNKPSGLFLQPDPSLPPVRNGTLVSASDICDVFDVKPRTLTNWLKGNFPQPCATIGGRTRKWFAGEVARWAGLQLGAAMHEADQAAKASN